MKSPSRELNKQNQQLGLVMLVVMKQVVLVSFTVSSGIYTNSFPNVSPHLQNLFVWGDGVLGWMSNHPITAVL